MTLFYLRPSILRPLYLYLELQLSNLSLLVSYYLWWTTWKGDLVGGRWGMIIAIIIEGADLGRRRNGRLLQEIPLLIYLWLFHRPEEEERFINYESELCTVSSSPSLWFTDTSFIPCTFFCTVCFLFAETLQGTLGRSFSIKYHNQIEINVFVINHSIIIDKAQYKT